MTFAYTIKTEKPIDVTVEEITNELKKIGFGVLGILDFKDNFHKKGMTFDDEYKIMEVCNPISAKSVLEINPEVGLLLPCTIAVYKKNNQNFVSLARPTSLLSVITNNDLEKLGKEIEEKLIQIINKLR